jgi:hypothetical protein
MRADEILRGGSQTALEFLGAAPGNDGIETFRRFNSFFPLENLSPSCLWEEEILY